MRCGGAACVGVGGAWVALPGPPHLPRDTNRLLRLNFRRKKGSTTPGDASLSPLLLPSFSYHCHAPLTSPPAWGTQPPSAPPSDSPQRLFSSQETASLGFLRGLKACSPSLPPAYSSPGTSNSSYLPSGVPFSPRPPSLCWCGGAEGSDHGGQL